MRKLFISYRRQDTESPAGRIYDHLESHFGRGSVFMDVDAIYAGADFRKVINKAVDESDLLLAIIGREWLTAVDGSGRRRLDDPDDFVRLEIGRALERGIHVVPVLVLGAAMPAADELPDPLRALAYLQASEVRSGRGFRIDVRQLLHDLRRVLPAEETGKSHKTTGLEGRAQQRKAEGYRGAVGRPFSRGAADEGYDSQTVHERPMCKAPRKTALSENSLAGRSLAAPMLEAVDKPGHPLRTTSAFHAAGNVLTSQDSWQDKIEALWASNGRKLAITAIATAMVLFLGVAMVFLMVSSNRGRGLVAPAARREPPPGMVYVSAGQTMLGATESRIRAFAASVDELSKLPNVVDQIVKQCCEMPPSMVDVDGFWIDRYEVTNAEYAKFVGETGHPAPKSWKDGAPPRDWGDHPVTNVSYSDAQAYAAWAGKKLPTEVQWLRAFRGEADSMFPWGDEYIASKVCVYDNMAFAGGTSPVNAAPEDRTSFGVVGMAGNVSEIVRDRARRQGALAAIFKGGNNDGAGFIYSLAPMRTYLIGDSSHPFVGFRCVIEDGR